jgi:hypothetical protein
MQYPTTTPLLLLTANGSTPVGSTTIREGIKAIGYVGAIEQV